MADAGDPLPAVLLLAGIAFGPALLAWAVLRVPGLLGAAYGRFRPPPPAPAGPPVERLAADLRRVRRALREMPGGTSAVRRRGTQRAYDELLAQACAALDVEQHLGEVPDGADRSLERLRVEQALVDAGLHLS